jgi:hypothetical protein
MSRTNSVALTNDDRDRLIKLVFDKTASAGNLLGVAALIVGRHSPELRDRISAAVEEVTGYGPDGKKTQKVA